MMAVIRIWQHKRQMPPDISMADISMASVQMIKSSRILKQTSSHFYAKGGTTYQFTGFHIKLPSPWRAQISFC